MYDPRTRVNHHGGDHSYGYANRERKVGLSYESCINWLGDGDDQEGVVQFRPNHNPETLQGSDDEYGFGFCASPLWQDSPSPTRSPSQPLLGHNSHRSSLPQNSRVQAIVRGQKELHNAYRSLSPNSRVQAIVRGQRELMEMVKNMPESSYELSLKDLVENDKVENQNQAPGPPAAAAASQEDKPGSGNNTGSGVKVGQRSDKNLRRSGSFENKGLFLKMGLPGISLQKRSNSGGNNNNNNNNNNMLGKLPPSLSLVKGIGGRRSSLAPVTVIAAGQATPVAAHAAPAAAVEEAAAVAAAGKKMDSRAFAGRFSNPGGNMHSRRELPCCREISCSTCGSLLVDGLWIHYKEIIGREASV